MRYGLYLADLSRRENDSQGIVNYALGLAAALPSQLAPQERLFILANPSIAAELESLSDAGELDVDVVAAPRGVGSRLVNDHRRSLAWARQRGLRTIHFPKGFLPFSSPRALTTIATVHDDIAVRLFRGELGPPRRGLKGRYFAWATGHAMRSADHVLTVSAFSAARLSELVPGRPPPITVTYEGVTLPAQLLVSVAERRPQVVVLGSPLPHKGTARAVTWTHRFLQANPGTRLGVTVTGRLDPATERDCASLGFRRVTNVLSLGELAALLARSRVLVFGSAYEGFGLPPVEAYSLGTPATYLAAGAMAEILSGLPGGHGDDYQSFADAFAAVLALGDRDLRALQTQVKERYQWRTVAKLTLDVYRSAVPRPTSGGRGGPRRR